MKYSERKNDNKTIFVHIKKTDKKYLPSTDFQRNMKI